jgi:hypothetical protein
MAASDHIHPGQLRMLMTSSDIKGYITGSVDAMPVGNQQAWRSKENPTLQASIRSEGVHTPVVIQHVSSPPWNSDSGPQRNMGNGHHRVETSGLVQKETGHEVYIPVVHTESDFMGRSSGMQGAYPKVYNAR